MRNSVRTKLILEMDVNLYSNSTDLEFKIKNGFLKKQGKVKNWENKYLELDGLTLKCYDPKKIKVKLTLFSPLIIIKKKIFE